MRSNILSVLQTLTKDEASALIDFTTEKFISKSRTPIVLTLLTQDSSVKFHEEKEGARFAIIEAGDKIEAFRNWFERGGFYVTPRIKKNETIRFDGYYVFLREEYALGWN